MICGLIQKISDRSPKGAGQDERHPKKQNARYCRPIIDRGKCGESYAEDQSPSVVSELCAIGRPNPEFSAERLPNCAGHPVEDLSPRGCAALVVDCSKNEIPGRKWQQNAG